MSEGNVETVRRLLEGFRDAFWSTFEDLQVEMRLSSCSPTPIASR
jgi:hypothetical protein